MGQLITFINSLLQKIDLELHYFETTNSSSYALLKKIFSDDVSDWRVDMFILRTVEAYLNLPVNVANKPPASENPEEILTRFQEKLPNSPIDQIVKNLVDSAKSESVEDKAVEDVIKNADGSYQNSTLDDEDNEFDLTQSQTGEIIGNDPTPSDEYEREEQKDQTKYPRVEMDYKTAVKYLKRIAYLSDAPPSTDAGESPIWTIGENYADTWGYNTDLTLQKHIANYNEALKYDRIAYDGNEELVFIELVDTGNEEDGADFLAALLD